MIQDVDEALRTLVRREALPGTDVDVAFDAPTKDWSARRNAPTLDLYLYDIREDLQRREVMWQAIRDSDGIVQTRQPPPRHYKLSYLVTAWTQRPEDEHRLLSAVLSCFVRHEKLPNDVLTGALVDSAVYATIALPPPQDRPLSDVWSALGGELKPSLDLVIVAPLVDGRIEIPAPPVMELPRFDFSGPPTTGDAPVEQAQQSEQSQGRRAVAGVGLQPGDDEMGLDEVALEAEARAMAGPKASRQMLDLARQKVWTRAREVARAEAARRALADETIESGTSGRPGRTIRLRIKGDRS
jgi:Pvc16 N-terminal domain